MKYLFECYHYKIKYKTKYEDGLCKLKEAVGYVFAKDSGDARIKLECKYGNTGWDKEEQQKIIDFEINRTDFIELERKVLNEKK